MSAIEAPGGKMPALRTRMSRPPNLRTASSIAGETGGLARSAELGLLEVPVFDVEDVSRGQRLPAAERRRARDDVDRMVIDVGGDGDFLGRATHRAEAQLRIEEDPRGRIEHDE